MRQLGANAVTEAVAVSDDKHYIPIKELARRLGFSVDTIRRHIIAGKLKEITPIDFLGNGKLRFDPDKVEAFIRGRREATEKVLSQPLRKSRA